MKLTIITCLVGGLMLSSCSSTDGSDDSDSDYVLMPSISKNANRGNAHKKKPLNSDESNTEDLINLLAPSPTPAQQAAALAQLQQTTEQAPANHKQTREESTPTSALTQVAESETSYTAGLRVEPVLHPEADAEAAPPPPPNEVELRGLRSPSLPKNLPLNF